MKGLNVKKINLGREIKYTLSSLLEWLNYLPGADRIETANYPVWSKELPEAFDGLRIAVLSDLHGHVFGKHQKRLEKAVREAKPDLILVAGDWVRFDYRGRDKRAILDAVRALTKIAPVFGNFGNHEALADHREAMAEELKAEGARILVDESLILKRTGKDGKVSSIRLTGLDTPFDYYHGHSAAKCREAFIALAGAMHSAVRQVIGSYSLDTNAWDSETAAPEKALFSIAIAHRPELLKVYAKLGFDLVLCGHAHGGLMRLPGGKRLLAPDQGLFPAYTHGMFVKEKTRMLISEGLGGPRIMIRPQLALLTLSRDAEE